MYLFLRRRSLTICLAVTINAILLSGCGEGVVLSNNDSGSSNGSGTDSGADTDTGTGTGTGTSAIDAQLRQRIDIAGVTGDVEFGRTLPAITDPLAQLGKELFFTTGLGGDLEVACVTCHHPNLGGGDDLSLSVGVGAVDPLMLGPGRVHEEIGHPYVPRNAPTVFNMGLWDRSIFLGWTHRKPGYRSDRTNGDRLFQNANITAVQQAEIVSFLEALTDPCVEDPMCMRPWVANPEDAGLDGMQLNGVDRTGTPLGR